ncbi:unnamed protein product [Cuscuta epithymum]|uniref:Uncharacterized protein n=1 Tax=Cuscuta epithymum TaxID=186058 RepID=A0AAV0FJM2_9ASTE|nr:unnamed protein product [Cuscuta epithymum]
MSRILLLRHCSVKRFQLNLHLLSKQKACFARLPYSPSLLVAGITTKQRTSIVHFLQQIGRVLLLGRKLLQENGAFSLNSQSIHNNWVEQVLGGNGSQLHWRTSPTNSLKFQG